MSGIIQVENLGKKYQISHHLGGGYLSLRDSLMNALQLPARILSRQKKSSGKEDFWALQDLNFEIQAGEAVGIIGRNGAGKSTLLKILSRITPPTTGRVVLQGRVASLLEVGTGFHPELTGRENIYLNGAILGMSRAEIKKNFAEIVAFAEIEKFLDTPVKRYSSGMYVRLAFAVAAHLEPEILLVDEVLAVGDVNFQKKCLGKMGSVIKESGRTILFVSHNMSAVQNLCAKSILLESGRIEKIGPTNEVINKYLDTLSSSAGSTKEYATKISGFKIKNIKLLTAPIYPQDLVFSIDFDTPVEKKDVTVELHLLNTQLSRVQTAKFLISRIPTKHSQAQLTIINPQLPPGNYTLDISMHTFNTGFFYGRQLLFFEILPGTMHDPFVIQRKDTLGSYPQTKYVLERK